MFYLHQCCARSKMLGLMHVVFLIAVASRPTSSAMVRAEDSIDFVSIVEAVGRRTVDVGQGVGVSIGIAKDDAILCSRGFGLANVEWNIPVDDEAVFRIGSITKEFTAVAILLLVDDGEIALDDPLNKFLPDYPRPGGDATIRQLLQHTSGIKDFTRLPKYRQERPIDALPQDVLARFQHLPLEFASGSKHDYCNSGFFLLALVVERASGKTFRQFVEGRLFAPLKLTQTYCDSNSRIVPHRAAGYTKWGGVLRNAPHISLKQTVGAGNLSSTVTDLLKWQRALVSNRLISQESLTQMLAKGSLEDETTFNYGLGVRLQKLDGNDVIRHGGGISGFRSDVAHYPKSGYTIAVLANSENVNAAGISDQIARRLHAKDDDAAGQ